MEDLLPYFERELALLRRDSRDFAARFPRIAGKLQLGADNCDDPHVERLIESVALMAARISKRLDDTYPQLTEALFEMLFPHYLRPFPACSIVRVGIPDGAALPRGTTLRSAPVQGMACTFRTVYDIGGSAVVTQASFHSLSRAPAGVALPVDASASISLTIEAASSRPLRLFIDGDTSFCAALRDTLLMRSVSAHVELGDGSWIALPASPVLPVGFADDEALIPFDARSHPAYRVLSEYFAFPEKFSFIDIDVAAMQAVLPAPSKRITLYLGLAGIGHDSSTARLLGNLSPDKLLAGCSPVVNLFARHGDPISVSHTSADYTLLAHPRQPQAFDIHSITSVRLHRQHGNERSITDFTPFYASHHGTGPSGHYWVARRDAALAESSPGHETRITLVDTGFDPLVPGQATLSTELLCTNRDLPCQLGHDQADGDLACADGQRLQLLRRPSRSCRYSTDLHWRLASHLALNHHALTQTGLPALRDMLSLYDLPQSPVSQRQIAGIVGLEHAPATAWMRHARGSSLVHGVEVRMTLDEEAFVGGGMHLFIQVMDQFLGLYVQVNSFVELLVLSHQSGKELLRCQPRNGHQKLV